MSGFIPETIPDKTVAVIAEQTYTPTGLDIIEFAFNARGNQVSFAVRFNRDDGEPAIESYVIAGDDFDAYVMSSIDTIRAVRAGCWKFLQDKGLLGAGEDSWPGA